MDNSKFKLYRVKDYCEDSLTFKAIKYAAIDAWTMVHERYKTGQALRPNPDIIKSEATFEDILYHVGKKNNFNKENFMYWFKNGLSIIFKGTNFGNHYIKDFYEITKKTKIIDLYNYLKTKEICSGYIELLEKIK